MDDFLHLADDGKTVLRVIGPGAWIVADDSDPDVIRFKDALRRANALARAEEAQRQEALRQMQQAEIQRTRYRGDPPEWRRA